MAGVPHDVVARGVEDPVQGHGEFDGAEVGSRLPAGAGDLLDEGVAYVPGQFGELALVHGAQVGRAGHGPQERRQVLAGDAVAGRGHETDRDGRLQAEFGAGARIVGGYEDVVVVGEVAGVVAEDGADELVAGPYLVAAVQHSAAGQFGEAEEGHPVHDSAGAEVPLVGGHQFMDLALPHAPAHVRLQDHAAVVTAVLEHLDDVAVDAVLPAVLGVCHEVQLPGRSMAVVREGVSGRRPRRTRGRRRR